MTAFYKSTDQAGQPLNVVYAEDIGQFVDVFSGQRDAGAMSLLGPLPTPNQAPTVALGSGGITGTAYQWALYWITGILDGTDAAHIQGRTPFGTLSGAQALTAQKATITLPGGLTVPTGAIGWGVARNKSAGSTWYTVPGSEQFLSLAGTMPNSFVDNVADASLVTLAPTVNTTGTSLAGAVEATTVAGLGAAVDGKVGRLRTGSSPYDFTTVIYDATYGKWVSEANIYPMLASNTAANSTYAVCTFSTQQPVLPWRGRDTAGLKPQIRVVVTTTIASGDNCAFELAWDALDLAAGQVGATAIAASQILFSDAGPYTRDTGWTDIGTYTVHDFFMPSARSWTSNNVPAPGRLSLGNFTFMVRWVG